MKNKEQKILLLLDSHAILHRAYHAIPDFRNEAGEPTGALYGYVAFILKAIKDLKPDYIAACFDLPGPTFRHDEYKEYKAGRAKVEDDLIAQLKQAREVAQSLGIPVYEMPGFEADDMLGTIVNEVQGKSTKEKVKAVIASGDMDTLQLVKDDTVVVYTLKKGLNDTIVYNEDAVKARFGFEPSLLPDYKGLRGDPSDNIIGVKGVGEKTAEELIQKFGTLENIYEKIKKDKSILIDAGIKERMVNLLAENEDEAMFSKALATIRNDAPIDYKLPEKSWLESIDAGAAEKMMQRYGFRSLLGRFKELVAGSLELEVQDQKPKPKSKEKIKIEIKPKARDLFSDTPNSKLPTPNFKKLQIMAWLVDSEKSNPTAEEICEVAGVDNIEEAEALLDEKIKKYGLEKVLNDIELPLVPIIDKAEKLGVLIDKKYLKELSEKYHKETDKLQKKIWEYAGGEFNLNSPKQLGEVLFDKMKLEVKGLKKTAGGARSTRESELEKLKDLHPIINSILEYREYEKLLTTYIDNIPGMLDGGDRLHANLVQTGTTTGRMSSNNPNIQNIPIRTELGMAIRRAFMAPSGKELVAFDYSQIELRVAAELSGDENLIRIFKEGGDIHAGVASAVFGVPADKVDKEMRRRAKIINFGIIYGMGVTALKTNLGVSREEAQQFYDAYFAQFNKLEKYLDSIVETAKRQKYTTTLFGRRRYYKKINSPIQFVRAMEERMAGNAPLQGTAADIIKLAMSHVDKELITAGLADKTSLLMQVHDELVYEVEKPAVPQVARLIDKTMETVVDLGVPLDVHVSHGPNWAEMTKTGF